MTSLDTFFPNVKPWAPGVSDIAARNNLRNAVIEFCERTRLWKYEHSFAMTTADLSPVTTPTGSVLHDLEVAEFDGNELCPKSTVDLDRLYCHWRTEAPTGCPQYITQIDQGSFRIVPQQEGTLYLCVRLKPSETAIEVPDFIANEYRELIGWGALGRLLMVPEQSYSNPERAVYYAQKFTNKLDGLTFKGSFGQQNAPKRTRSRFF